ncbi:MAG: hypothetical protein Q8Q95_04490 [bacterium]|nr:hypothetical protein [bacterium]
MKKVSVIPLGLIDGLAYGDWSFAVEPYEYWLMSSRKVVVIPTPNSFEESFNVGMAESTIRRLARRFGRVVVTEGKLAHRRGRYSGHFSKRITPIPKFYPFAGLKKLIEVPPS